MSRGGRRTTLPVRNRFGRLNGLSFGLNGFRIGAKIDKRPFPAIFGPYVINHTGIFRGLVVELESTPKFSSMIDIAVADMHRKGLSPKSA
jgi:hypothetical protein